jgi:ABC-2 type transport system permease protein
LPETVLEVSLQSGGAALRILTLAWKDLRQVLREWRSLLAIIVLPILFTAFMGFTYRPAAPQRNATLSVGVVLEEDGWLATRFERALQDSRVIAAVRASSVEQARAWIAEGRIVAAVVVPSGFGARLGAHEVPQLTLLADPATGPGQLAKQAVHSTIVRLVAATEAAHRTLQIVTAQGLPADGPRAPPPAQLWSRLTARAFDSWPALSVPIDVERAPADANQAQDAPSAALLQASPGMIVMFAILGLIRSALVLVQERRQGTLARLLTTTTSRVAILGGHWLGVFSIVFGQGLILVLAGQFAFGLDYLRAPFATLALLAALSLWVTSLALCIGAVAKGPEQVVLFGFLATILFCGLGGTWFPLDAAGAAFVKLGELTPAAWAMRGFHAILSAPTALAPVTRSASALLGYAALFFVPAVLKTTPS